MDRVDRCRGASELTLRVGQPVPTRMLHRQALASMRSHGGTAHWPPIDAWSHPGMEAYATTMAMLALQALQR